MTVREAFRLSPKEWEVVESKYEEIAAQDADGMVAALLKGATFDEKKFLAWGIMVGRQSMRSEPA